MSAVSIATKFISLIFAGSIILVLFKRVKVLKKYGLISMLYLVLISILLAAPTLLLLFDLKTSDMVLLILVQSFILLLGIAHVLQSPAALPWYKEQSFIIQILFILCIVFLAYFFSDLSLSYIVHPKLRLLWFLSLLWFVVPSLLNETVNLLMKVPPRQFKKWVYPLNEKIADPTDEELKDPLVVSFVFRKNAQHEEVTTFRVKAPVGMQLGRLFYFFINDYNERHPGSRISYADENGEPHGWVFMKIRNKLLGLKSVADPEGSITSNDIRENDELICSRI